MKSVKMKEKEYADQFSGPRMQGPFSLLLGQAKETKGDGSSREEVFHVVKKIVSGEYTVLSGSFDRTGIFIKVIVDPEENLAEFNRVRLELRKLGFFPKLVDTGHETIIAVFPLPARKRSRISTNIILLVLTIITTVWAGAILWAERTGQVSTDWDLVFLLGEPANILMGAVTFAFPLLLILGIHELGHYFTSRKHKVDASLPYFIPVPPIFSPFGTFGALISMKEPISNRRALVDIGAAGPIAGFIVAIPVTFIGLALTGMYPNYPEMMEGMVYLKFNYPLLFRAMMSPLGIGMESDLYPTAIAGWIGLFVTSINLFPAGQLDGGHIARGLLGEKGKILSFITVAVLLTLGFITPFKTYLFFAFFILLMGMRHPPPLDDMSKITRKQVFAGGLSLVIMVLTFHPIPIEIEMAEPGGVDAGLHPPWMEVDSEYASTINITAVNTGRLDKEVQLIVMIGNSSLEQSGIQPPFEWNWTTFQPWKDLSQASWSHNGWYLLSIDPIEKKVEGGEGETVTWKLIGGCSREKDHGEEVEVSVGFSTKNEVTWTSFVMRT